MFPQRTYAGYVETEVLENGHVRYYIFLDGRAAATELTIDPTDSNAVRTVQQLHMLAQDSGHAYAIEGHFIPGVAAKVDRTTRRVLFEQVAA